MDQIQLGFVKANGFSARCAKAGDHSPHLCQTLSFQDHNLDWFPRMRAMSLVSSDADGEQNEIRSLQEKLESTMKLVSNLSGQLTELKEQVGRPEIHRKQSCHRIMSERMLTAQVA